MHPILTDVIKQVDSLR